MHQPIHTEIDPIREFDAHIYYSLDAKEQALQLHRQMSLAFANPQIRVGRMVDRPIGPHPLPMFEVNFTKNHFESIAQWLRENRGASTVLIHSVTGNDPRDHSEGATWLGTPLALDFSKLDPAP